MWLTLQDREPAERKYTCQTEQPVMRKGRESADQKEKFEGPT